MAYTRANYRQENPYLFTQSYSIWARSWLPCQDAPGIRFTYNATIKAPKQLMAAMSAEGQEKKKKKMVSIILNKSINSCLFNRLGHWRYQFKAIDYRTGIYAEPSMIDKAA
jgi:aminopeptidase N